MFQFYFPRRAFSPLHFLRSGQSISHIRRHAWWDANLITTWKLTMGVGSISYIWSTFCSRWGNWRLICRWDLAFWSDSISLSLLLRTCIHVGHNTLLWSKQYANHAHTSRFSLWLQIWSFSRAAHTRDVFFPNLNWWRCVLFHSNCQRLEMERALVDAACII